MKRKIVTTAMAIALSVCMAVPVCAEEVTDTEQMQEVSEQTGEETANSEELNYDAVEISDDEMTGVGATDYTPITVYNPSDVEKSWQNNEGYIGSTTKNTSKVYKITIPEDGFLLNILTHDDSYDYNYFSLYSDSSLSQTVEITGTIKHNFWVPTQEGSKIFKDEITVRQVEAGEYYAKLYNLTPSYETANTCDYYAAFMPISNHLFYDVNYSSSSASIKVNSDIPDGIMEYAAGEKNSSGLNWKTEASDTVTVTRNGTYTIKVYTTSDEWWSGCPIIFEVKIDKLPNVFSDVTSDKYYYDAVDWAVSKNITKGTGNNCFSPDNFCSREQVVTFLWRAMGSPEPSSAKCSFTDVDSSKYYYKAVLWAAQKGITKGINSTTFGTGRTVTRADFVTFLYRAKGSPYTSSNTGFSDVSSSAYYAKPIAWAVNKGVTKGTGNGCFSPGAPCTRGQVVTFLYRDLK